MAGSFPTLSNGKRVQGEGGFVHTLAIHSNVKQFRSGKEQRYAMSGLLNSFRLSYQNLSWTDLSALLTFWTTQKGAYDATWDITLRDPSTLGDRSYANMAFAADNFSYSEPRLGRYSVTLDLQQTVGEAVTMSAGGSFPTLSTGARVQIPANAKQRFLTDKTDLDSGPRISYYAWASPLRSWPLAYPDITDAEVQTIVNFWLDQGGPVGAFTFTDPDSAVAYSSCRFAESGLELTRNGKNKNALKCGIEQYLA